jgi:hypothetical protein
MPASVNALADRIAALLEPELHDADREVVACAFLTLAHRLRQEARLECRTWRAPERQPSRGR